MERIDLYKIMKNYPDLGASGFYCGPERRRETVEEAKARFLKDRENLKEYLDQCQRAESWLAYQKKRRTFNTTSSSYGLKHHVERWRMKHYPGDPYVSNGAFIIAALHLGFRIKMLKDGKNCFFNLSIKFSAEPGSSTPGINSLS